MVFGEFWSGLGRASEWLLASFGVVVGEFFGACVHSLTSSTLVRLGKWGYYEEIFGGFV